MHVMSTLKALAPVLGFAAIAAAALAQTSQPAPPVASVMQQMDDSLRFTPGIATLGQPPR